MATVRLIIDPENPAHLERLTEKLYAAGLSIDGYTGEVDGRFSARLHLMVERALQDYARDEVD